MRPPWEDWLLDDPEDELAIKEKRAALDTPALRARLSVSDGRAETIAAEQEVLQLVSQSAIGAARLAAAPAEVFLSAPPLETAARLLREDLVLLRQRGDDPAVIAAATVCFSFGQLAQKLGQPLGAVHAPVPGYGRSLRRPMDALFARLGVEKGFSRSNFELRWDPHLLHPSVRGDPSRKGQLGAPEADAASPESGAPTAAAPHDLGPRDMHLRVEYQTLRRLERSAHILFTVRTYSDPLPRWAAAPAAAAALHARIAALSEGMAEYKGIHGEMRPQVEAYLLAAANAAATA